MVLMMAFMTMIMGIVLYVVWEDIGNRSYPLYDDDKIEITDKIKCIDGEWVKVKEYDQRIC
jgi:hypothetical protein